METSTFVSRMRRSGRVPVSVGGAAARASVFSVTGTVLAVAGHHVVFDVSPSWADRGVLAGLLLALAFPASGRPSLITRQLGLALGTQALGVCWFTANAAPAYDRLSGSWPMVMAHVAMTVLIAFLLHGADDGSFILFRTAAAELRSLCAWLWSMLFPRPGAEIPVIAPATALPLSGPARASPHELMPADCVVRRGPPLGMPCTAA
ncbi:hypothetical protein [Streptomyces sp. JNUCC 63]